MTIQQIYRKYRILPALAKHQLRVAGVAKIILNNFDKNNKINSQNVLLACLLHDMGNVIKFKWGQLPELLEPEGEEYWRQVQREFIAKYGPDEKQANLQIVQEIGVNEEVVKLIRGIGFDQIAGHLKSKNLAQLICEYSDLRVGPYGVISLQERLADLKQRYFHVYPSKEDQVKRAQYAKDALKAEEFLFAKLTIKPEEITEIKIESLFLGLEKVEI